VNSGTQRVTPTDTGNKFQTNKIQNKRKQIFIK